MDKIGSKMVAPPGLEPRSKGDSIVEHWKLNELQNPLCWTATPRGYFVVLATAGKRA